jgi:hypothetical protein
MNLKTLVGKKLVIHDLVLLRRDAVYTRRQKKKHTEKRTVSIFRAEDVENMFLQS